MAWEKKAICSKIHNAQSYTYRTVTSTIKMIKREVFCNIDVLSHMQAEMWSVKLLVVIASYAIVGF